MTKKVILYAASVDGLTPETNIPTTLRAIINARSIGAAEAPKTELANQMRIMGLEEVGWHISFAHNLPLLISTLTIAQGAFPNIIV